MTSTVIRNAGPLTQDGYMVTADQETIVGNGTARDPLRAGSSFPSGVALQDEGSPVTGNPHSTLNFVGAGVTVTDVGGVGTIAIPGGIAGLVVQEDGAPLAGGPFATMNFVGAGVAATNVGGVATVTVSGVSGGTIQSAYRGGDVDAAPGIAVFVAFVAEPGGVTTVQPTDVRAQPTVDGTAGFASVAGVVAAVNGDGTVQFQPSGLLTLSTSQWDDVTGGSGGLTLGHVYYASTTGGQLTDVPPSGPGQFVAQVGVALSATTLLIQPQASVQNLRDLILFAESPVALDLGMAVYVDSVGQARPADQDVDIDRATAIGLVAAFDTNDNPIIQIGGVVVLTEDEWDVVAGGLAGPGLSTGHSYYVGTSASSGHITTTAPTTAAKVQVGIAFSSTQMVVPGPFLQRLS